MYLLEIKLHCNKKNHWVLIKCVIVFFRRGLEMPSLSSSRSGTTCLSWPIDWWGSTRQTTVPSRWPSTPTTSSCPYRKSTPTAEAKSDCWSTDKQGHLFIYKYMIKRDQNINVWKSYLFFSCEGAPVQKPCVKCPSEHGIQTCRRILQDTCYGVGYM